jgi:hypothetical protein
MSDSTIGCLQLFALQNQSGLQARLLACGLTGCCLLIKKA